VIGVVLSDRFRWIAVPLLVAALVTLGGVWAWSPNARSAVDRCWRAPESCAGQELFIPLVLVTSEPGEEVGVIASGRWSIRARGLPAEARSGDRVSVLGRFDGDGVVHVSEVVAHPWRTAKGALGFVGMGVLAVVMAGVFRMRRGPRGWHLTPRSWTAIGAPDA
jgi:hypothetical protein